MTALLTVVIYASFAVAFLAGLSLVWTGIPKAPAGCLGREVMHQRPQRQGKANAALVHPIFDVEVRA